MAFFEGKTKEQLAKFFVSDKHRMLKLVEEFNNILKYEIDFVPIDMLYGPQNHYKTIHKDTITKLKNEPFLPSVAKMGISRELSAQEIAAYKSNPQ